MRKWRLPTAVSAGCALIVVLRVPVLHRQGTAPELSAILQHPLPLHVSQGSDSSAPAPGVVIVYFYSESCPFCGMDRAKVRRASMLPDVSPARFVAVHVGEAAPSTEYWQRVGVPVPDQLERVPVRAVDSLGFRGIPVLLVSRDNTVKAAWLGHLWWNERQLQREILCRSGSQVSCVAAYATDVVHAIAGDVRAIGGSGSR